MKVWTIPVIWFILLTIGSLLPGEKLPGGSWEAIYQLDKILHFAAYFGLMAGVAWANIHHTIFYKRGMVYLMIALIVYGVVIELLQAGMNRERYFEVFDILANIMGLFAGYWISVKVLKR